MTGSTGRVGRTVILTINTTGTLVLVYAGILVVGYRVSVLPTIVPGIPRKLHARRAEVVTQSLIKRVSSPFKQSLSC